MGSVGKRPIQVPSDLYDKLVAIAKSRGRHVSVGRGGGLVITLREMAEMFEPIEPSSSADEAWAKFMARIQPSISALMVEATAHHERVDTTLSTVDGLTLKRIRNDRD